MQISRSPEHLFTGHSGHTVWGVGFYLSDTEIVGSNPAQNMDVCPRLSVLRSSHVGRGLSLGWVLPSIKID